MMNETKTLTSIPESLCVDSDTVEYNGHLIELKKSNSDSGYGVFCCTKCGLEQRISLPTWDEALHPDNKDLAVRELEVMLEDRFSEPMGKECSK